MSYRAFMRTTKASLKVQKLVRGKDVRFKIAAAKVAARKIQGWIKSIWLQRMLLHIKRAATVIQV